MCANARSGAVVTGVFPFLGKRTKKNAKVIKAEVGGETGMCKVSCCAPPTPENENGEERRGQELSSSPSPYLPFPPINSVHVCVRGGFLFLFFHAGN